MPCWTVKFEPLSRRLSAVLALCALAVSTLAGDLPSDPDGLYMTPVWAGLEPPGAYQLLPGARGQWLYLTRSGQIDLLYESSGRVRRLDHLRLKSWGNLGVQSLALHPGFEQNGRLYLALAEADPVPHRIVTEWVLSGVHQAAPQFDFQRVVLGADQATVWSPRTRLCFAADGRLRIDREPAPVFARQSILTLDVDRPGPVRLSRTSGAAEKCPTLSGVQVRGNGLTRVQALSPGRWAAYWPERQQLVYLTLPPTPGLVPIAPGTE